MLDSNVIPFSPGLRGVQIRDLSFLTADMTLDSPSSSYLAYSGVDFPLLRFNAGIKLFEIL